MAIEVHLEKRIINNLNIVREPDATNQREYLLLVFLGGLLVFGLLFYGWQHYQYLQYGYRMAAAEATKEHLAEMKKQLRLERASLRSPQRIESMARQLGMVSPAPGQVVIFRADSPLTIPIPSPADPGQEQLAARQ